VKFAKNRVIVVAKILPALAMADNNVAASGRLEHRTRNLAGESTLARPVEILCADLNADQDFAIGGVRHKGFERSKKSAGLGGCFVHLPVAGKTLKGFCWLVPARQEVR